MEARDKKQNPLIFSFPINLYIMPKLVLSCTERTVSFDKFSSHISCEMWEIMDHCLHWPKGFSGSPIRTKGIFLIRKYFPFLLPFLLKIYFQIFLLKLESIFSIYFPFLNFFWTSEFLIPTAISLEFGLASRSRCEFSSCFIIKTEDVILQMKHAECLLYDK